MEEDSLNSEDTRDKRVPYAYLDLLATTLSEHEKNLDTLIGRLEEIMESDLTRAKTTAAEKVSVVKELPGSILLVRLKTNSPAKALKEILESLKD